MRSKSSSSKSLLSQSIGGGSVHATGDVETLSPTAGTDDGDGASLASLGFAVLVNPFDGPDVEAGCSLCSTGDADGGVAGSFSDEEVELLSVELLLGFASSSHSSVGSWFRKSWHLPYGAAGSLLQASRTFSSSIRH